MKRVDARGCCRSMLMLWVLSALVMWGTTAVAQDRTLSSVGPASVCQDGDDGVDDGASDGIDEGTDDGTNEGTEAADAADEADSDLAEEVSATSDTETDKPIVWWPGYSVGLHAGWLFTNLDELNLPVFAPNNIKPIDAAGLFSLEAKGGPYISNKALINAFVGTQTSIGGDTTFSMLYGGLEPALVFPEYRFEFILGLKLGLGGYTFSGPKSDASGESLGDAGYDGLGLIVDPSLTLRYIAYQNLAFDFTVGFWQFVALTRNDNDALDLDTLSQATDTPLDWAAPHLSVGVVYGSFPTRPLEKLGPDGDRDGDGVRNGDDKLGDRDCARMAEDKDGFEDEDGCPDPDNDGDGLLDADDKCPNEHEDLDSFEDEDGCPDLDNDHDGVTDLKDKCPNEAEDKDGFEDNDGCIDPDNDKDGLLDANDKCPDAAEDKDGFEDEDGCPDPDNDGDGVLDGADKCPNEAEVINGVDDEDGCPDEGGLVTVDCEKINISDKIYFDTGKATIQAKSFPLLDAVAGVLKSQDRIKKLSIEGHTDDVGDDKKNKDLSQQRAESVREYLIKAGVAADRLTATGWGEGKPALAIDGLKGKALTAARTDNRRVEFLISEIGPCKDAAPKRKVKTLGEAK